MENDLKLQAVILAGGQGTRLKSVVADRPKVLAEVCGRPFLAFLLDQLAIAGIREVVLCTGYLGNQVEAQFGKRYKTLSLRYSQESCPLGTGGALRLALTLLTTDTVLVMNGDSYCEADLSGFYEWHCLRQSDATLLLIHKVDTKRYGSVRVASGGRITDFTEKQRDGAGSGLINAGIYLINRDLVESIPEGRLTALEQEMFRKWIDKRFFGYQADGAFIDIGTPESYAQAEMFFGGAPGE